MTTFFVIMALAVIVPVVTAIFCRRWAQNYRADKGAKVKTVGQALGLSDRVNKSALSAVLREIPLFSLGRSHSILYALEGECDGVAITIFELFSNPGSSHTRSNSGVYLLMRSYQLQSPAFALELADMHLGTAMKFDSHPEFARRFWLKGHRDNEDAVRNFFNPAFLTCLLAQPQRLRLWGHEHYLLYSGDGINTFKQITGYPAQLQAFVNRGLALWPQAVPGASAVQLSAPRSSASSARTAANLQVAATQRRTPKITQWNPLQVLNAGKEQQKQRIATLIVDLVAGGGTYKPSVHGMGARAYDGRQGKIVYTAPSEDPREARMRGEEAGQSQREMSREGLEGIIQASAENFFPVLNPGAGDRIDQATAEQLLTAIASQGNCNLTADAYKIKIDPINGRFIYQCDVPQGRHQYEQVRRSLNHQEAVQWLMEHRASIFAEVLQA